MSRSFAIGTEHGTGRTIVLTVHDGPRCGFDCECCGYGDGTFPADHARNCDLITNRDGDWSDCTCDAKPRPPEEP